MKPMFMMMVGLPYSGKSCYAEKLKEEFNAVVHSSDAIREEILRDVQDQNNNGKVFDVLHRRVIEDLSNGRNVIYDATNINYKRRMDTIQRLSVALIMHGFSWAFMIMLPIAISMEFQCPIGFIFAFLVNFIVHALVDNMKANERRINLICDQSIHIAQIILTFLAFT